MKKYRVVVIGTVLLALSCLLSGWYTTDYTLTQREHIVSCGETLWEIAEQHISEQDKIRRVDEMVWKISEANHLKSGHIFPGQVLTIPLATIKR